MKRGPQLLTTAGTITVFAIIFTFAGAEPIATTTADMYPPPGSITPQQGPRAHYRARLADVTGIVVHPSDLDTVAERVCGLVAAHADDPNPIAAGAADLEDDIGAPPKGTMLEAFHVVIAEECPPDTRH